MSARLCGRARVLSDAELSPSGRFVSAVIRTHGQAELVVVPATGGMEVVVSGDPDTAGGHPSGGGVHCWLPDESGLVYVGAGGGLWCVGLAGGPAQPVAPAIERESVWTPAISTDGQWLAWTEDTRRVVVSAVNGGEATPISAPEVEFVLDPVWAPDGARLAWTEWDAPDMPWDSSRIMVASPVGRQRASAGPQLAAGGHGVAVQQPRFDAAGRLGWIEDSTGWANVWATTHAGPPAPVVAEPHEQAEPAWGPGQRSWCWSPDRTRVAYCRNEDGFGRLVVHAVDSGEENTLAKGWHHRVDWKGATIVAARSGATTPTQLVAFDPDDGQRTSLIRGPRAGVEGPWLVEPEVVQWRSADGLRIPARVYRPPAGTAPSPVLMWLHGGPTGQMTVTFNARVAFFVSRGWIVVTPDHRGSSGWGRAHVQALHGRWGSIDPPGDVADCGAGLEWLATKAWARSDQIVVMGASAGGMTALLLMAHFPERCAAGVDLYGVTDLESLAANTHRFEAHYTHHLIGPLPESAGLHRARSPVAVADRIRSPLLILHGSDDKVVPVEQSLALRDLTLSAGNLTEMHVYEGEGHGWTRPETVEDELDRTADFLSRHVTGATR